MASVCKKKVTFHLEKNTTHETLSSEVYNRFQIDSTLYQRAYNRISQEDWQNMLNELNVYKCTEMVVHKDSVHNMRLH